METLHERLKAAGIPVDHHESDLYCLDTPEARRIINEGGAGGYAPFKSQEDGAQWLDIPFAYAPFWQERGCSCG